MPRAPKHCGINGCTVLVRPGTRCPDHTGWNTSPRTASSTATRKRQWQKLRKQVLDRDAHICQIRYEGVCTHTATVVDKIIPASKRPDLAFTESNLRSACAPCNDFKARKHDR